MKNEKVIELLQNILEDSKRQYFNYMKPSTDEFEVKITDTIRDLKRKIERKQAKVK